MDYRSALLDHLATYRVEVLGIHEVGNFRGRDYPHILPKSQWPANFVAPIRDQAISYVARQEIKRHTRFHHLNSSQAFALNLFLPLLLAGTPSHRVLLNLLGIRGEIRRWEFEAIPDKREQTNFDLMLDLTDGRKVYCEVKLTESGFGSVKPNEARCRKRVDIYLPRLRGKVPNEELEEGPFFRRYQLLRNLSYVDTPPGSELLLIFPFGNQHAQRESRETQQLLSAALSRQVRSINTDEIITAALSQQDVPQLARACLEAVAEKYLIGDSAVT